MNYFLIFVTGLTSGGLSCLAVQGGLLAAIPGHKKALVFLGSKLLAHTLFGFMLGILGSAISLTIQMKAIFALIAGVFMVSTALAMIDAHPIFRYFILQPPKFIYKFLRNVTKDQAEKFFAPVILGFFTILIPCGTTQAMEVLAISSGNGFIGALTMFSFVLGTIPTFYVLSFGLAKLNLAKVTAIVVFLLGVISINSSLNLFGSNLTLEIVGQEIVSVFSIKTQPEVLGTVTNGVEEITINISSSGYFPNSISVHRGSKVKINLVTNNSHSCANDFTIPSMGIEKFLPATGKDVAEFLAPDKPTIITFTCGMGMYRGQIKVI